MSKEKNKKLIIEDELNPDKMTYVTDSFGNIVEIAGYLKGHNIITSNDNSDVIYEKKRKQLEILKMIKSEVINK